MEYPHSDTYGIPHPVHVVYQAEKIVYESIPAVPLEEIGVNPELTEVLAEGNITTVGQLYDAEDTIYNLPRPIDDYDRQALEAGLGRVGLRLNLTNNINF